jgi:hypothetical protein
MNTGWKKAMGISKKLHYLLNILLNEQCKTGKWLQMIQE